MTKRTIAIRVNLCLIIMLYAPTSPDLAHVVLWYSLSYKITINLVVTKLWGVNWINVTRLLVQKKFGLVHNWIPVKEQYTLQTVWQHARGSLSWSSVIGLIPTSIKGYVGFEYDGFGWLGCTMAADAPAFITFLHPHLPPSSFTLPDPHRYPGSPQPQQSIYIIRKEISKATTVCGQTVMCAAITAGIHFEWKWMLLQMLTKQFI